MIAKANQPKAYQAVRAVGILKPEYRPQQGKVFADSLEVKGTAFVVSGYKIMITCAHVVRDLVGAPVEIAGFLTVGNRGMYNRATVAAIDYQHDLALLSLEAAPGEDISSQFEGGLKLATKTPEIGTKVAYAGFPLGNQLLNQTHDPTYAEGVVSQIRGGAVRKDIQITGPVTGGFSGSPVVVDDIVVGVLSDGPSTPPTFFSAVSWEHIDALLRLGAS